MQTKSRAFLFLIFLLSNITVSHAQSENYVPEALKDWQSWVLEKHPEMSCPFDGVSIDNRRCVWPSHIKLELQKNGLAFAMTVQVLRDSLVELPGQIGAWPTDVQTEGHTPLAIVESNQRPHCFLKKGRTTLNGKILWRQRPQRLMLPHSLGLIKVFNEGREVSDYKIDEQGGLWTQNEEASRPEAKKEEAVASLNVKTYRKFIETVPFQMVTRLVLEVSGPPREAVFDNVTLDGFSPVQISGPLAYDLKNDGRLTVKLEPGIWSMTILAHVEKGPVEVLTFKAHRQNMPDQEFWVYQPGSEFRVVRIEENGPLPTIDPGQLELPDDFKNLSTYLVKAGMKIKMVETRRGIPDPDADRLTLNRQVWFDFDGPGATIKDNISGQINRNWRLNLVSPYDLQSANVSGSNAVITKKENENTKGVEIRQGQLGLEAISRLSNRTVSLPATGWMSDFNKANTTFHLPPGVTVIAATGSDSESGTWINRWTLLSFFFVFVVALAMGKLRNYRWAAIIFITLVLCHPEANFPTWIWLHLILALALSHVAKEGLFARVVVAYKKICQLALLILLFTFSVQQLQSAIYPVLSRPHESYPPVSMAFKSKSMARNMAPDMAPQEMAAPDMEMRQEEQMSDGGVMGSIDAPSAPPADAVQTERKKMFGRLNKMSKVSQSSQASQAAQNLMEVDPSAAVQTGPGIPNWSWQTVQMSWSGPIKKDQKINIWSIGPTTNRILAFVRIALLTLVFICFMGWSHKFLVRFGLGMLLFLQVFTSAQSVAADNFPSTEILLDLEQRLTQPPRCVPHCVAFHRIKIHAEGDRLALGFEFHSLTDTFVELPINLQYWRPSTITVNGKEAKGLSSQNGRLMAHLGQGTYHVEVNGQLKNRSILELALPLHPSYVSFEGKGWVLEGLRPDGTTEGSLLIRREEALQKKSDSPKEEVSSNSQLRPYIIVEREIFLGLKWTVTTRVRRISSSGEAINLKVPVIPGESILDKRFTQKDNLVDVNLGPSSDSVEWTSSLNMAPELSLVSASRERWSEVWSILPSSVWNVETQGLPPIYHKSPHGERRLTFMPMPGEKMQMKVTRPTGAEGNTLTILQAQLGLSPGKRATDATLSMTLRSSKGTQHIITMPENVELKSVQVNGANVPLKLRQNQLELPLSVGDTTVNLEWMDEVSLSPFYHSPKINLAGTGANLNIALNLPANRWVLAVGGPLMGPVVLFWGKLILLVLAGWFLGRANWSLLSSRQWILLSLGLTQIQWPGLAIIFAFFVLISNRSKLTLNPRAHNLTSIGMFALALASAFTLFVILTTGLLEGPQMDIAGNNSYANALYWYQDRISEWIPRPWLISFPNYVFQLLMLFWALWLSFFLIKIGPDIWKSLSFQGLWKRKS
ncbi:MAG: hypothetical protein A2X86_07155 [Bdellovibrionales bacterium GWA2_49_15]|nr:MAG: hypothetical protein A2X86_07155 [Bdellovibrionales bacterium GWA2_49_15]HAZ11946.1 hypothetical protein [Bdellovibrionales bacterium]